MFRHSLTPPLAAGFPCYERVNTNPCLFSAAEKWIYPEFSALKRSPGCERGWSALGRVWCARWIPPFTPSTSTKSFISVTQRTFNTPKAAPGCDCDVKIRAVRGYMGWLCPLLPWHLLGSRSLPMGAAGRAWRSVLEPTGWITGRGWLFRIKAGRCSMPNSVVERNLFIFWVSLFPERFVARTCSRAVLSTFLQISFWYPLEKGDAAKIKSNI